MRFSGMILLLFLCLGTSVLAQQVQNTNEPGSGIMETEFVDDNLIVAALDSLSNLKYFESVENTKNQLFNNKYNFLPNFKRCFHVL